MDELTLRLLLALGIAAVAGGWAAISRRGAALRRRRFRPVGLEPGLHLFSSNECGLCARARSVLDAAGHSFVEHSYESSRGTLESNGVDRVPTLAWVPDDHGTGWLAEGVPSERALARWLGP